MTDNEIKEQLNAIESTTKRLLSEGPEACKRFLIQIGLDEYDSVPSDDTTEVLEKLVEVHNLLAKSDLSYEQYNPISKLLCEVKLRLFTESSAKVFSTSVRHNDVK